MQEKYFDGIILPFPFRRMFSNKTGIGNILGISMNTLETAPKDIRINIATPRQKALDQFDLYWLENCPEGNGPWGKKACYYWLLKEFSDISETGRKAIRVKPTDKGGIQNCFKEDYIFWENGKPASLGHQYFVGNQIAHRLFEDQYTHFGHLIEAWKEEKYNLWSMTIGEIRDKIDSVIGNVPIMKIVNAERSLAIDARNAGWSSQYPLVEHCV